MVFATLFASKVRSGEHMDSARALQNDSSWDEVRAASERYGQKGCDGPRAGSDASVQEIAARGERIYEHRYKAEFETLYPGQFVAIDIDSERTYFGATPNDAYLCGLRVSPGACLFLVKVGASAAFAIQGAAIIRMVRAYLIPALIRMRRGPDFDEEEACAR